MDGADASTIFCVTCIASLQFLDGVIDTFVVGAQFSAGFSLI